MRKIYHPDEQHILYEKAPLADLLEYVSDNTIYFQNDDFPPSLWMDRKLGVKKFTRIKDSIKSPQMYAKPGPYDCHIEAIPKISDLYLNDQIPNCLKDIANTKSIQNK